MGAPRAMQDSHAMKVLVAMSGGVDSSVAAALLAEAGHDVAGVTLRLWGGESDSGCCSVADVTDAAAVAARLGIPHHVFNMSEEFDRFVVDPYVADHQAGRTPNPCIECNRHVKFDLLLQSAERLGFDAVATGHHAQIFEGPNGPELHRGADQSKDQSYVLSMLTEDELARVIFPIGHLSKETVRQLAAERSLRTATKADSQEVCFIERSKGRARFLERRIALTPGVIVEAVTERVVGKVEAVELFTVGQKQGLGVDEAGNRRVAVAIEPAAARVVVADEMTSQLEQLTLLADTLTWVRGAPEGAVDVFVQVRAHGAVTAGRLEGDCVVLAESMPPVAPGQTVAFYDPLCPDRLLGSARLQA